MDRKIISQREARALQRRVRELEAAEYRRREVWASDWPGGVHLTTVRMAEGTSVVREVLTARKLGHAVVVVANTGNEIQLYALPLPEPTHDR